MFLKKLTVKVGLNVLCMVQNFINELQNVLPKVHTNFDLNLQKLEHKQMRKIQDRALN